MNASARGSRRIPDWALPVGIVVLGFAELGVLVAIAHFTSLLWALAIVVFGWIIGFALLVSAGQQSITRIASLWKAFRGTGEVKEHLSRPAFTLLAALLFFFPGVMTDVAGFILLFTPVQEKALKKAGMSAANGRRVLFSRSGRGVIQGEIVLDSTREASEPRTESAGRAQTGARGSGSQSGAIEGEVI